MGDTSVFKKGVQVYKRGQWRSKRTILFSVRVSDKNNRSGTRGVVSNGHLWG